MSETSLHTIVNTRYCSKCDTKAAVAWYTKRGVMGVQCLTCGKTWEYIIKECDRNERSLQADTERV